MAGFGGALKNISIGIASPEGKANIHSAGKTADVTKVWSMIPDNDTFQESMAEASKAIIDHIGDRVLYINVANNLSVDCDCVADPAPVAMADLAAYSHRSILWRSTVPASTPYAIPTITAKYT